MNALEASTVYSAFEATAGKHASDPFLVVPASACRAYASGGLQYTYAQALAEIRALRGAYGAAGLGAGQRVAILLENRPAFFFHWFALNALGVSVVPINPDYRSAELEYLLDHSEVVLAVSIAERVKDLQSAADKTGRAIIVTVYDQVARGLPKINRSSSSTTADRKAESAVLYTSGTTGRPKGCLLSNEYFLRMGLRYLNRRGPIKLVPGKSRILTPLPMFHMNAMAGSTMGVVMSGSCLIQLDRFHPSSWWSDVKATQPTGIHYLGVMPAMLLSMPEAKGERDHGIEFGTGANVEPAHHAAFESRFGIPLIEGWAMTETGSGAAISAER